MFTSCYYDTCLIYYDSHLGLNIVHVVIYYCPTTLLDMRVKVKFNVC